MRYISTLMLCVGLAAIAGACADSQTVAVAARRHEVAAQQAQARGDYREAEAEQRAANKQWDKAARRDAAWGGGPSYYWNNW